MNANVVTWVRGGMNEKREELRSLADSRLYSPYSQIRTELSLVAWGSGTECFWYHVTESRH